MENPNIKVENTKRTSSLTFEAVSADEVGEYVCVASNKAGFANSSTTLIVKGFFFNIYEISLATSSENLIILYNLSQSP